MAKNPFMPTGSGGGGGGNLFGKSPPGGDITPGGGSSGKPGAKKGMPNFKARITKPGGMAKGGKVKDRDNDGMKCGGKVKMASGGAVKAGQGSGIGRLARSK